MTGRFLIVSAVAAALLSAPAFADRDATVEESARIEQVLRASGFNSWDSIRWDEDGWWEVDDARRGDDTEWDLRLAAETLEIVRARRDD